MADYAPGLVSSMLNIPPSTLRRYVRKFKNHFSSSAKRRRNRTFNDDDIAVLVQIRDLSGKGHTLKEIGGLLDDTVTGGSTTADTSALALPHVVRRMDDYQNNTNKRFESLKEQQAENERQLRAMREILKRIERESKTPWWKKIFGE